MLARIAKDSSGRQGKGIRTYRLSSNTDQIQRAYEEIIRYGFDVIEELLYPHPEFSKINSSGFPCIRILTFLNSKSEVDILSAFLTVGVGDDVINLHRGGIAMNVDVTDGIINSVGVDKIGNTYEKHPLTNYRFSGFYIPMWSDLLKTVESAAHVLPNIRYVGWDVGICKNGPVLIEANAIRPGITSIQVPCFNNVAIYKRFEEIREGLTR